MWTLSGFADEIDADPVTQFRTLNELGIRFVEFRSAWGTNVLDLDDDQLAEIKRLLAQHGIGLSAVGFADRQGRHPRRLRRAPRRGSTGRCTSPRNSRRPFIRIFSFWMPDGDDPAKHRDEVLRRMSALAQRVGDRDVVLAHENERKIYGDIPSRCLDLVESVGSDKLRLVWDPANFVLCDVAPFTDGFTQLRPYVDYLQIKDAVRAEGKVVPAGEGDGQIPETIRALAADGFDSYFSMEPHLAYMGESGGFSGPELFTKATKAFTGLLDAEGIAYH